MFPNLKLLKEDMIKKGWIIDGFLFSFRFLKYDVLVKLYGKNEPKPSYASAKLEFIDAADINRSYTVHANSRDLININVKSFREFFRIPYGIGPGNAILSFKEALAPAIPSHVREKTDGLKKLIVQSLSRGDSEDPRKIHCTGIRRNEVGKFRTDYNDNKARILTPILFNKFFNDKTISFCFSENIERRKPEEVIIRDFLMKASR